MNIHRPTDGLVYSTEQGKICPRCEKQIKKCNCNNNTKTSAKSDGIIRVERSVKGRKGKGVSLITGLSLDAISLRELAKKLKQKCGTGGTVKDGVIEIQGNHRDFLVEELKKLGITSKKAGG